MTTEHIACRPINPSQYLRVRMNAYPVPVPEGESAISSLIAGTDGRIYGATSGRNCHIFSFCNILGKNIKVIQDIPGPASVVNSLAMDEDMNIYAGVNTCDADGILHGTLYSMKIQVGSNLFEEAIGETSISIERKLSVLNKPVAGEGILSLLYHGQTRSIIGITTPGAKLFKYSIEDGTCTVMAEGSSGQGIVARKNGKLVSKHLIEVDGMIYGTGDGGHFFSFDAASGKLSCFSSHVPCMQVRRDWNSAECLCKDESGNIYGGTTDGFLFKFSPCEDKLINFGKPSLESPINGLVYKEGFIYGVCGSKNGIADMFSYDLGKANFTDLGMINYIPCEGGECDNDSLTPWSAWQIGVLAKDRFGTIYLGETDSKGHLFTLFI